jgi:hypothetical protein
MMMTFTSAKKNLTRSGIASMIACAILPLIFPPAARGAQSVSLAWNADTAPDVAGYVLYAGANSTNYTTRLNVGTNTTITVTGLKEGSTDYFAVTAYNSAGIESPTSTQISYLVPGLLVLNNSSTNGNAPQIRFPVAVGHSYQVQASTDLHTWTNLLQTSLATSNAWFSYSDPQAAAFQIRFYRLVMN